MATIHSAESRRRLDLASLTLLVVGIACGAFSYWLTVAASLNALIIVPSIVAATIGALHLVKHEAPRA